MPYLDSRSSTKHVSLMVEKESTLQIVRSGPKLDDLLIRLRRALPAKEFRLFHSITSIISTSTFETFMFPKRSQDRDSKQDHRLYRQASGWCFTYRLRNAQCNLLFFYPHSLLILLNCPLLLELDYTRYTATGFDLYYCDLVVVQPLTYLMYDSRTHHLQ